jgi:glutamine synthetase
MGKVKLEYVWLDGYQPEPNLRSKTKILKLSEFAGELDKVPMWSFDGSSTQQAEGHSSDCILKPVSIYRDTGRKDAWLVMCEVLLPDGSPHPSNARAKISDGIDEYWFGFEQEYTFVRGSRPLGFPTNGFPAPQGMYYCSVGDDYIAGRDIVEEHLDLCIDAGLDITGINAEVMLGQWEYQCFGKGKKAGDDAWIARYLLFRTAEKYDVHIEFAPKPVKGDWNGSGMHTNFSNQRMRENGSKEYFMSICEGFEKTHHEHILVYGSHNEERLTGLHETQHIGTYSFGESDRGASIRIPVPTTESGYKSGYLEDRRPASNADPYKVIDRITRSVKEVS